jgi:hypothetical protein
VNVTNTGTIATQGERAYGIMAQSIGGGGGGSGGAASTDSSGTFRYKDYRRDGAARYQVMTLEPAEFIRRFLLHVLPRGFHRIRHYGLFASAARRENLARVRQLLAVPQPTTQDAADSDAAPEPWRRCPCCGGSMIIVEVLARTIQPRTPPATAAPPARAPP